MKKTIENQFIPCSIPQNKRDTFKENYNSITRSTSNLFLFACDQKIEHLHKDFYPYDDEDFIDPDAANPEHLFKIAQHGTIGAIATHLGLIARYASTYNKLNYIVKLSAKTDIIPPEKRDPKSAPLWSVEQAVKLKETHNLNISGIGLTVYLGSEHEADMLSFASKAIFNAHQHGLVTIIWMYPRGKAIEDDQDPQVLAGAAGVAASLGADFVKIKPPRTTQEKTSKEHLKDIVTAAGNTKVICSGGAHKNEEELLQTIHQQISNGGTHGCAVGRNIFQRSLPKAIALTNAISAIVYDNSSVEAAKKLL